MIELLPIANQQLAMYWYGQLSIHQRINIKECFEVLCGISWENMGKIFSLRVRITIIYDKLQLEGFDI